MAFSKSSLPTEGSPKSITSLVGAKLISAAYAYNHGSVVVVELALSDASTGFIKLGPNSALEIGGTPEMGSGTKVSW